MADFSKALEHTLKHEGMGLPGNPNGFVDDPNDPGGVTVLGISRRAHGEELPAAFFQRAEPGDAELIAFQREGARALYLRDYWHDLYADLNSQLLATRLFDLGVNMGVERAVRLFQQALGEAGAVLAVDGAFGPQTLDRANTSNPHQVDYHFGNFAWRRHYYPIMEERPSLRGFAFTWSRRCFGEID